MEGKECGFIFDMDGTLFHNMKYHLQAWEKIAADEGSGLKGEALFRELYGKNSEVLQRIFPHRQLDEQQIARLSEKKEEYYRDLYLPHVTMLPGLKDFLIAAYDRGVRLAIGTGSYRKNIDILLEHLNISYLFSAIIGDDDVEKSKPDPETFVKAANQLKLLPKHCVVFEDVPKGIEAAKNAGMKAVVILTSHAGADFEAFDNVIFAVKDYTFLDVQEIVYLACPDLK